MLYGFIFTQAQMPPEIQAEMLMNPSMLKDMVRSLCPDANCE